MTLLQPLQLLWLALLPLLWWLSLPPRPRDVTWTAHLAQYEQALAALRRRPPRLGRWRFLWLALAAIAAAIAAAQPVWRGVPGPRRLVVVLDASASMGAVDASGRSAWRLAKERLTDTFATVPPHVDVTVLRAGGALRRRHGASARSLHDLGEPAGPLAVDLAAVAAAAAAVPDTVVWTLTDGQGQTMLPTTGALSVLSRAGDNASVLAVRAVDAWPLPRLDVAVDVRADVAVATTAVLRVRGALLEPSERTLSLAPGALTTTTFELQRTPAGGDVVFSIVLPGDVLPLDDHWHLHAPPLPAPRIAALAENDGNDADSVPFAQIAARALAAEVGGDVVAPDAGLPVGLLLVDGGRAAIAPGTVRALTFGSGLAGIDEAKVAPWLQPGAVDWDRSLPLCAGLDLSELRVQRAWHGLLPAGEPFLWAVDGERHEPLAVVVAAADRASVHFGFRLADSNLPLLAAFPQLLRRAFVRCYGAGAELAAITAPPAPGEQDLRSPAAGADRPLPPFGRADLDLSAWWVLAGLLALAARAFTR